MTITVKSTHNGEGMMIFVDGPLDIAHWQALVQRGANLWPDAPAQIKSAADWITSGHEMQPYATMSGERKD